ncbi:MAG: hypothetical protein ACLURV_08840 [Gallintestinimicrobium sp.]
MVRPLILWMIGGLIYTLLEIVTRGRSHWTMFIVGGLCFYLIGLINEVIPWKMAFWKQCVIGSFVVTGSNLFRLYRKLVAWLERLDYSNMPQSSGTDMLAVSLLWVLVSGIAVILDDHLRYWLFGEESHITSCFRSCVLLFLWQEVTP